MNTGGGILNELERLIDLSLTRKALLHVSSGHWMPALDIYETDSEVIVFAEVAGVRKNHIDVSFSEGFLTISGVRNELCCDKLVTLHRMEIDTGRFLRKIRLSIQIREDAIEAECKNGILRIILPKEDSHG